MPETSERGNYVMVEAQRTTATELAWLTEVSESRQPLNEIRPIWVRHGTVHSGPSIPHPEQHPYCEFGTHLEGNLLLFVEGEQTRRVPGDLFLIGPGVPHWSKSTQYPVRFITIYFLPSLLIEQGPEQDGARMLRRFMAPQTLSRRLVRPPAELLPHFSRGFEEMAAEFENPRIGREMRLRAILVDMLVRLLRWEESEVENPADTGTKTDWQVLSRALHYLRSHFTETVYARDVTAAAGVCQSRLEEMFREALGISWVHFLQSYRIARAAALLSDPRYRVIEVAMAVGFENLSHFNASFLSFMRVSPTAYQKGLLQQSSKTEPPTAPVKMPAGDKNKEMSLAGAPAGGSASEPPEPRPDKAGKPKRRSGLTAGESSLSGRSFQRADFSHVQMTDCQVEGMTINGILVSDMMEAYRKAKG